jgi:serine protease Do
MNALRSPVFWISALVVLLCLFIVTACNERPIAEAVAAPVEKPFTAVRIDITKEKGDGHGSGVSLGHGVFLTAGHVTEDATSLTVKTRAGKSGTAEVLWSNHAYDVSVIYVEALKDEPGSPMACAATTIGEDITIVGNPLNTEFATSWGRISSLEKTGLENLDGKGLWRSLVTMDATAAPGVSGGPIFDKDGEIVGILVSGAVSDRGTFGYSYMVPSTAICRLLGRA